MHVRMARWGSKLRISLEVDHFIPKLLQIVEIQPQECQCNAEISATYNYLP